MIRLLNFTGITSAMALVVAVITSICFCSTQSFGQFGGWRSQRPLDYCRQSLTSLYSSHSPLVIHHTAIQTSNITRALMFYSDLLGMQVECKFRAGPAKAAWIGNRLELIEVPPFLMENDNMIKRAPDLIQRPTYVGQHHFALDVTEQIKEMQLKSNNNIVNLQSWLDRLNATSLDLFGKTVRLAVPSRQQLIGGCAYELAFIYDADGCIIELLNCIKTNITTTSGWTPWDGTGFVQA